MSLTTLGASVPTANYLASPQAPNFQPQQPPSIPGTRNFMQQAPQPGYPAFPANNQPMLPKESNEDSDDVDDVDSQLATYKKKPDNGQDGQDGKTKQPAEFQIPEAEKFQQIAETLSQKVQIDPAAAKLALSGDTNALNTLLGNFAQQLIMHTMHGSVAASTQFGKVQQGQQAELIEQQLAHRQLQSSIQADLGADVKKRVPTAAITAAMQELIAEYPNAPAKLLAQKLNRMFGGTSKSNAASEPAEVNWMESFMS